MTTAPDPLQEFQRHLPNRVRASLNVTQAVVALVHAAVHNHGWTPALLAQECSRDLEDVVNAGAVVTDRLRKAATHPPVGRAVAQAAVRRPLCGQCEDGWLLDPDTRLPAARCECRKATA